MRFVRVFVRNKELIQMAGSLALLVATFMALLLTNRATGDWFQKFWDRAVTLPWFVHPVRISLRGLVNEGGMTLFFLGIGLEMRHEFVTGDLNTLRKASLPVVGALGGMLMPACLYLVFCHGMSFSKGWGIPIATDIAFAAGILSLLGKRVPSWAKVFLVSLAVVDDVGSIAVIAFFYAHSLSFKAIAVALLIVSVMGGLRFSRVPYTWMYLVLGIPLWLSLHSAGIHPTLTGVVVAAMLPFPKHTASPSSASAWENGLSLGVAFVVLPLFALCNASVVLPVSLFEVAFHHPVTRGVLVGLLVGKPLGILMFLWLGTKLKLLLLPQGASWGVIAGVSLLAGIGFTISLFMAQLSFAEGSFQEMAKVGIFLGSLGSAVGGSVVLWRTTRSRTSEKAI